MAVLYNPTDHAIEKEIQLPLYYTGLQTVAHISEQGKHEHAYTLHRDYSIQLKVSIPPAGITWYIIR